MSLLSTSSFRVMGWGGTGSIIGEKQSVQQYSNNRRYSLNRPPFKDIPLSNFDLLEWVQYLKIPNFKGIYSRNNKNHIFKTGCCIINLEDEIGNGTHWVATYIKNKNIVLYFDSFCLPPPQEFLDYAEKHKMKYQYHYGYPFQELESVRCGCYCLYFLDNIYKMSFHDCLNKYKIDNQNYNEKFIKKIL